MRPALLRMALRYVEDSDEAEDVTQDVLLKLWFLRDRLDTYRSIDALAAVIVRHLSINCLRRVRPDCLPLDEGLALSDDGDPERKLVAEETFGEVMRMIDGLPTLQQAVLRMKHLEGMEVEEIARLTGSVPSSVRSNLSRARKQIRERFMNQQ